MHKFVYLKKFTMKKILFLLLFIPSYIFCQQPIPIPGPMILKYKNPTANDTIKLSLTGDTAKYYTNQVVNVFNKPIKINKDTLATQAYSRSHAGSGLTYLAGSGLTLTGNTFSFGGSVTGSTTLSPLSASALSLDFGSSSNTALRFGQLNFRTYLDASNWTELLMSTSLLSFNGSSHRMIQAKKIMSYDADYSSLILQSNDIPSLKKVRELVYDSTQNIITASKGLYKDGNIIKQKNYLILNNDSSYRMHNASTEIDMLVINDNNGDSWLYSASGNNSIYLSDNYNNVVINSSGTISLNGKNTIDISTSDKEVIISGDSSIIRGGVKNKIWITVDSTGAVIYNSGNKIVKIDSSGHVYYVGTFAGIKVTDASTAQSIPTGATYTKLTGFTNNGESSNCTADAANDKITIIKKGRYLVTWNLTGSIETANVMFTITAFLGGTEVDPTHAGNKFTVANDVDCLTGTGIVNVSSVPVDLDLRAHHDNGGSVNITPIFMNMNVTYLGE